MLTNCLEIPPDSIGTAESRIFQRWRVNAVRISSLTSSIRPFSALRIDCRINRLARPENCCNLDKILILYGLKCV